MMASRKKTNESFRTKLKNTRRHRGDAIFSTSSSDDDTEITGGPRTCKNTTKDDCGKNRIETDQQAGQDSSRRDENPFSFKHFLQGGTQTNFYGAGARPKVYSSPTPSPNNIEKDAGVYSRNPTELPDFVQDHLVLEQCYLNHDINQQAMPDVDNLPDFALNSVEQRQSRLRMETKKCDPDTLCDLQFDLTGSLDKGLPHRTHSDCTDPLELPAFDRSNPETIEFPKSSGFPLDLPIPSTESDPSSNTVGRGCTTANDTSVPKSLPDFINDGLMHNRTTLPADPGYSLNSGESTERRLLFENERLRHDLEVARKQITEKSMRIYILESELASRREVEHEETAHLEKAMEQVEDNLKRSTRRAVSAESTVNSLKKEIRTLSSEISQLRLENKKLRSEMGASVGSEFGASNMDQMIRRLAGDLRSAASSAEISLRQLMSGVDNLRVLASTLENVDRIEDRTKDYLLDFDEDNAAGPAL